MFVAQFDASIKDTCISNNLREGGRRHQTGIRSADPQVAVYRTWKSTIEFVWGGVAC